MSKANYFCFNFHTFIPWKMITHFSVFLLIFYPSLTLSSVQPNVGKFVKSRNLALIIAISEYKNGLKPLHCYNDVPLIKQALLRNGFYDESIYIIKDKEATKDGIKSSILRLIDLTSEGDNVAIFYSGHGQQISDDNGDEVDGLDECLVPYDAINDNSGLYKGEYHIRDEEFGELLTLLRIKAGKEGHVFVCVDACHSATISKGNNDIVRGLPPLIYNNNINYSLGPEKNSTKVFRNVANLKNHKNDLSSLVIISACGANEKDREVNMTGPLSYSISEALNQLTGDVTYQGLYDKVKTIYKAELCIDSQTPWIEGDKDVILFQGKYSKQNPFYEIDLNNITSNSVEIKAGRLNGLFEGSVIGFYPIGTIDIKNATKITEGVVISSREFSSKIKLFNDVSSDNLANSWAFVLERSFGSLARKLKIEGIGINELSNEFLDQLKSDSMVYLVQDNPDYIVSLNDGENLKNGNKILLKSAKDNNIIFQSDLSKQNVVSDIISAIKKKTVADFFKLVNMNNEEIILDIGIFPFIPRKDSNGDFIAYDDTRDTIRRMVQVEKYLDKGLKSVNGSLYFDLNDLFQIRVANKGLSKVFLYVMNIQEDNTVKVLDLGDITIEPKQVFEAAIICSNKGWDYYKIFGTTEEVKFNFGFSDFKEKGASKRVLDLLPSLFRAKSKGANSFNSRLCSTADFMVFVRDK